MRITWHIHTIIWAKGNDKGASTMQVGKENLKDATAGTRNSGRRVFMMPGVKVAVRK